MVSQNEGVSTHSSWRSGAPGSAGLARMTAAQNPARALEPKAAWRSGKASYLRAGETIKSLFRAVSDHPRPPLTGSPPGVLVTDRV